MSSKTKEVKYITNLEIIDSKIDDEVLMMNVDKGMYFGLDNIGSVVWEKLVEPDSISE